MLRRVELSELIPGRLLLRHMPGRRENLAGALDEILRLSPVRVICLAPESEIEEESPAYLQTIRAKRLPFQLEQIPIEDFAAPTDRNAFLRIVHEVVGWLIRGERIVVHCAAGVGRSGMFAQAVLHSLGIESNDAKVRVEAAGAGAEAPAQLELLAWVRAMKSVYVIEMDRRVLEITRFVETSPGFKEAREPLYVGMTGLAPPMRFLNHKRGHKPARFVRKYGLHLRPDLYLGREPLRQKEAEIAEKSLAQELRRRGHAVRQH